MREIFFEPAVNSCMTWDIFIMVPYKKAININFEEVIYLRESLPWILVDINTILNEDERLLNGSDSFPS